MDNQNITQISCIENLIDESKAFLNALAQQTNPVRIVLRALDEDGNDYDALLYEQNTYVLIVPKGDVNHARIYGNWEEALYASKRILLAKVGLQKEPKVSIGQYLY